jgi:hypothetical protein
MVASPQSQLPILRHDPCTSAPPRPSVFNSWIHLDLFLIPKQAAADVIIFARPDSNRPSERKRDLQPDSAPTRPNFDLRQVTQKCQTGVFESLYGF